MTRPTRLALLVLGLITPLAALPAMLAPELWAHWLVATLGWLILVGLDLLRILPSRALRIEVATPEVLHVGAEDAAALRARLVSRATPRGRAARIEALLELGERLAPAAPVTLRLDDPAERSATVPLVPARRGAAAVSALWLRWQGPFGLVERTRRVALDRTIPVIPNIRAVREEALRFFARRQALVGQKIERYIGEGSEFESLREYQPGYDPRGLDWRATARHRKLLVREFQAERNHPVVVAIDTGRLMREPLAGIARLDWAINAALLLAYVALKTGDRVGVIGFDSDVSEVVLPRRGIGSFPRIQQACARLEYGTEETNFTLAVTRLTQQLRRRSLVVLFTDFVDSITAELMLDGLKRIGSRHLLLFVGLRDPGLVELRDATPSDVGVLHRAVVADQLLRERDEVFRELRRLGIQVLDRRPDEVSAQLVHRYLRIRRREMVG